MKKYIFIPIISLLATLFIFTTPVMGAKVECSILPQSICDAADSKDQNNNGIMMILKWVIRTLTALIGVVAVGMFIFAGVIYSSASGDSSKVSKAKNLMFETILGLLLYMTMFFIINWLVPGGVF